MSTIETDSVLIIDNNATFLHLASRFLEEQDDMTIVGISSGGEEALVQAQELRPQVSLLDLAMPGISGLKAIALLRRALPELGLLS